MLFVPLKRKNEDWLTANVQHCSFILQAERDLLDGETNIVLGLDLHQRDSRSGSSQSIKSGGDYFPAT